MRGRAAGVPCVAWATLTALATLAPLACAPRPRPLSPVEPSRTFIMPVRAQCDGANDTPEVAGAVGEEALVEASGVVASPTHAGVLWLHNDAGNEPFLYALSTTGAPLGALGLPGVDADDLEDIAAGPCPDLIGACLYVCDCGDNDEVREELVVYAVSEPDVAPDRPLPGNLAAQQVWRFPFVSPEGPVNIEAFVVLPDVSAMLFWEKEREQARVLRMPAPWTHDVQATVQIANRITAPGEDLGGFGVITGADVHPSGERVLLRTYVGAYEAVVDPAGLGAAALDGDAFTELFPSPAGEEQGEAIAYDEAGTGVWTVSESPDRTPGQPLHHTPCR